MHPAVLVRALLGLLLAACTGCLLAAAIWPRWARLIVQRRRPAPTSSPLSLGLFNDLMLTADSGTGTSSPLTDLQRSCQAVSLLASVASTASVAFQAASGVNAVAQNRRPAACCGCCCSWFDWLLCASAVSSGFTAVGDLILCCLVLRLYSAWSEAILAAALGLATLQNESLDLCFALAAAVLIGHTVALTISLLTLRLEWLHIQAAAMKDGVASVASTSGTSDGRPRLLAARLRSSSVDVDPGSQELELQQS